MSRSGSKWSPSKARQHQESQILRPLRSKISQRRPTNRRPPSQKATLAKISKIYNNSTSNWPKEENPSAPPTAQCQSNDTTATFRREKTEDLEQCPSRKARMKSTWSICSARTRPSRTAMPSSRERGPCWLLLSSRVPRSTKRIQQHFWPRNIKKWPFWETNNRSKQESSPME